MALQDSNGEPADEVHHRDHDRRDRVASNELGGAVHGPVEVGLVGDLTTAASRVEFTDRARSSVGVDGHLLAGHPIEGEARGDLSDATGPRGDHDELDDDQDEEDDESNDDRTTDDEVTETRHHHAGVAVQEDLTGHGHVEREAEHGRDQHQRGEHREIEGSLPLHGGEQHEDRTRDVPRDEQVDHECG